MTASSPINDNANISLNRLLKRNDRVDSSPEMDAKEKIPLAKRNPMIQINMANMRNIKRFIMLLVNRIFASYRIKERPDPRFITSVR